MGGGKLCILTIENLQLPCYKHNIVVSYTGALWINSLWSTQWNYVIGKSSNHFFFSYIWNERISFFPSEKIIDPWKISKCLPNLICLHNILTNNYLHIFSSLCTHVCIYVSLNTNSISFISYIATLLQV